MTDREPQPGTARPAPHPAPSLTGTLPVATLLRDHDWSASSLGPYAAWPQPLRAAVAQVLDTPVAMWLGWGPDLSMVYNRAYEHLLGDKHPAAMGAPLREVWAEIWSDIGPLVDATLAGEGQHREDLPLMILRRRPLEQIWVTFSYAPLRDEAGVVRGLICTVWETTANVLAQRRLAESEAHLKALLDDAARRHAEAAENLARSVEAEARYRLAVLATNDAIWDWRLGDGHVVWNQALTTLFGHSRVETTAQWWLDHIHPDDRERTETTIHAVIDGGGSSWSGEYRFCRADGSYAHILDRGTVLRDAAGQPARMIGAMLDLTERKTAEAALRESERQFRTLFESIDEGFCVIEFLDGPQGPLSDYVHVIANPAYAANTGIPDVVGQRVRDMVPDEAESWVRTYRRVLVTGEPVRFEQELLHTGRHLELAAFRVEPAERRQVAVLFQDVTQRHRAERALRELNDTLERRVAQEVSERTRTEEALRQSQKMEAVGQLTGGIAHDFNNMLAGILGSVELLGRRFAADDPRAMRYIDAAKSGVKRAAQLTQRLLAFSRQQPLNPEAVDVNKLVAGMSDLLRHSLGGAVRLETVLAGGLWRTHADPNQLENAILNLAVNARDAIADDGRLTIETANCHLDERYVADHLGLAVGQYVMIAVSDTGSGMTPEVAAKAFDPFFTTKEVGRGTGLGLSQVYGFVKQSGGHVKIYSEPGQGTAVKVYLPRHLGSPQDEPDAGAGDSMPFGDRGEVVLVVEDEAAVRQFSVEALTELGYRVLEADGAEGALKCIDLHPDIALLFTDVVMPGVNGRKLADEARRRRPGLKVLFTTGYTRNAVVHNGVLDPGVHLLGKPFTLDELAARVRAVLDEAA